MVWGSGGWGKRAVMADTPGIGKDTIVTVSATGHVGQVVRRRLGKVLLIERGSGERCCVLEEQVRLATEEEQLQWMVEKMKR